MSETSKNALNRHVLVAPHEAGRLDRFLAASLSDFSRSQLQDLIRQGVVSVGGRTVRVSHRLRGGEEIVVSVPVVQPVTLEPEAIDLPLLYLDADIVVVDKPAGMVVHPARGHHAGTLVHALLHAIPDLRSVGPMERPGIVHRIDKGTSGILVVALHDPALRRLQAQFMIHSVERRYLAVVHGVPRADRGTVVSYLDRHPSDRQRFASTQAKGKGRRAVTHWRRLFVANGFSLLSCKLETGRTHQIRVHLTEMGHPIVGDPVYGRNRRLVRSLQPWEDVLDHQLLHAGHLGFEHPVSGRSLSFDALPPADFRGFCEAAGISL